MAEEEEQERNPEPGQREPALGQEVMSSLPHRRPQRRSTKRAAPSRTRAQADSDDASGRNGASGAARETGTGARAGARTKRGGRAGANARAKPSGSGQKRGAARQPQAGGRATEADRRGAARQPLIKGPAPRRRQPRRAAGAGTPVRRPSPIEPPTGTEIVGAAVHVAGELAQAGLSLGGRVLRSALRLPRL